MDITNLPTEAIFNLLLQVQPHEIGVVCRSKNSKVRKVCTSDYFHKAYAKKFPKKLMSGKITSEYSGYIGGYIFTDEKRNQIEIEVNNKGGIREIIYTPYKQYYPSTYREILSEDELRKEHPLQITLTNQSLDGKSGMYFGRDFIKDTGTIYKYFKDSYNQELKEFLDYIEKPNWWDDSYHFDLRPSWAKLPEYKPHFSFGTEAVKRDFFFEIVKALQDVELTYQQDETGEFNKIPPTPVWQIIKPFKF